MWNIWPSDGNNLQLKTSSTRKRRLSTPETATDGEGGPPAPNLTSNRRLQQTQAQVDEVVDIMRVNVDKVLERDQKLSELDDRADALQAGASQFESSAAKLKNKYWWKNCKMMIIMAIVGLICFGVIFPVSSVLGSESAQQHLMFVFEELSDSLPALLLVSSPLGLLSQTS
ncbi:vesicle-associated membrane protein 2-like [Cyclopterus lumpus]|uniref:vesicle-associated membrane protein 2-like n=1 Tax=Cyclopterus lumpus TaxID=8103 RepID=UPI0014863390|nr:vesicle-associated membrane protein 2-like [Cyclopterus lumpus]